MSQSVKESLYLGMICRSREFFTPYSLSHVAALYLPITLTLATLNLALTAVFRNSPLPYMYYMIRHCSKENRVEQSSLFFVHPIHNQINSAHRTPSFLRLTLSSHSQNISPSTLFGSLRYSKARDTT